MWGLYPWFEEQGISKVHPEDLDAFRSLGPYGKVFQLVGESPPFIILSYGEGRYRVDPSLFKEVPDPGFRVGDVVVLEDGSRGKIIEAAWHHERGEPFFHLLVDGKKKSRRYWRSDLRKPEEN